MRINHNIQALNAYRNLYSNQAATSKNLERLSSGLRINRAADDAAGLAISEKMRSQIRGLKQAERNSMDGISLMQTAEGAMTEVHSMLQRMRELAVQAANDTNTTSDRASIQKEIDQLLLEIDSIAGKTEFNTRKLLDGSSAVDTQYYPDSTQNNINLKEVPTVMDPSMATGKYGVVVANAQTSGSYVKTLNQPGAGVSTANVIASSAADFSGSSIGKDLQLGEYTIVVSKYEEGTSSATVEVFDPDGFSIGSLAEKIGASGSVQTVGTTNGKQLKIDFGEITGAGTAKIQLEAKVTVSVEKYAITASGGAGVGTPITFSKELTTANGKIQHGGLELKFGANIANGTTQFDLTNKALVFQIGANTNQNVNIDVPQLSTVKLGIDKISVLSYEDANQAMFKLDQAINQISATRSKLGATQNRLEHTINNLQVTHENLTSAESRVRDADMALEMTEFTKNNILNQSAQAMLAQANQLPQGVLQLLQG
ncbi:flagellin [Schinkia azotoformans]|uniref:flagellin N-terminal helical domain-containing protein n=1 Tax=Schinkia azotoformans TaxID=1454 RepID=UPI002E1CC443|nr:flagellin [Schinkia azotoformans]MED4350975.1 flagellin [Schinkia azotoformans]